MFKYTVINVGQGDSTIIDINGTCKFSGDSIITDLGSGNRDVIGLRSNDIILCLTHSHQDHIGGLSHLYKYINNIKQVWIPAYYEEIIDITDLILNIKGMSQLQTTIASVKCTNAISCMNILNSLKTSIKFISVYDGKKMCNHIRMLNPPLDINSIFGYHATKYNKNFEDSLLSRNFSIIENWFEDKDINRKLRILVDKNPYYEDYNINNNRIKFIVKFLSYLKKDIEAFINNPIKNNFLRIYNKLKLKANDCSIVSEFIDENNKVDALFTGDSGKKVFNRLIKEKKLNCSNILKVPHHGSKENINKKIMSKINPNIAIVSHNNGIFGTQKDPHPSKEVIDLLREKPIETLYTNDVIKSDTSYNEISPTTSCNFVKNIDFLK